MMAAAVAILDAGAQYGKVIDRRIRELCVETAILPLDTSAYQLKVRRRLRDLFGPGCVWLGT